MMTRYLLVSACLLISGCNTMAGLGDDMNHYGQSLSDYARQQAAAAPGDQAPAPAGSSASPVAPSAPTPLVKPTSPAATAGAPVFTPGERVTLAKPAILRAQPRLDAPVVAYVQPGETYEVFGQQRDWVEIGTDQKPTAWVFDTFLNPAATSTQSEDHSEIGQAD